jgi:hypothetical protein
MTTAQFIKRLFTAALCASVFSATVAGHAEEPKFVGTGSCSSSNCHGSVRPRKGTNVLQNEYVTWLKHDKHSQAYSVLMKSDAKRMAALLNLKDPTKEPLCLKCHSTYVPDQSRRGEKFTVGDGVSCESCHGAAERYLETHVVQGATHDENLKNGLTDTVSLNKRATLCLSCHYGSGDAWVSHDLYGAGHPRLRFELDTFGVLEPKHWVVDDDYLKRKAPYIPLSAWLIGQEAHAECVVNALLDPAIAKRGIFPELSLFDCYSCHHSLTEEQWKSRTYGGEPGRLALNLAPLVMLQHVLGALDASLGEEFGNLVTSLQTSYQQDGAPEALKNLQTMLSTRVKPLVLKAHTSESVSKEIMGRLASFGASQQDLKYEVAEQIGMGIQAAMATSPHLAQQYKTSLDQLFATLSHSKSFKAEKFTAAAAKLSSTLSAKPAHS